MGFQASRLIDFARDCLRASGLAADRAGKVAEILVEAEMMGHDTHGLALLPGYVAALEKGTMLAQGDPEVVSDRGAVAVWDGRYLPGVWLTASALDEASKRARDFGVGVVTVRRSHHIACLQAYLPAITGRGQVAILCCSDPSARSVAPFGGVEPLFTPNPIAFGIPTGGDPILIDISSSITTNAMTARLAKSGGRFPGAWAVDHLGNPTDDPKAVAGDQPGALLPVGGLDHGHKGYALAIMVEALSQGLAGHGRADAPGGWGASVFVQVFEPECFAGFGELTRQMTHLAETCRSSRPIDKASAVRLPGEGALARGQAALTGGLALRRDTEDNLVHLGQRLSIGWPAG